MQPSLRNELGTLKGRVAATERRQREMSRLQERVEDLEARFAALGPSRPGRVIVLRALDRDRAKQEIRDLFQTGATLGYSDFVERLRLDAPLVVELCKELIDEGEIEVDANALQRR